MTMQTRERKRAAHVVCVVVLLVLGVYLRVRDIGLPYDRHFEGFSGGAFANSAELHIEHGIDELGWFPIFNRPLPKDRATWHFYTNHPATIPLIHYGVTSVCGVHEWSLRLPHVLGSIAILVLTFALARALFAAGTALIALAIAAFLPGLVAYGTLPNYENLTLPVMLGMIWLHARAATTGSRVAWSGFVLLTFVGAMLDWPAILLVPGLALARLFVEPTWRTRCFAALRTGLLGAFGFVPALVIHQLLIARTIAITGLPREQIVTQSLAERANTILEPLLSLDLGPWFDGQVDHVRHLIGIAVALPALFGMLLSLTPFASRRQKLVLVPGIVTSLGYVLAFARHSIDQDLFWIYALPFVALCFAFPFGFLLRRFPCGAAFVLAPLVLIVCALSYRDGNALRDAWRGDLETASIGHAIDAKLPADVSLYIPAEAGWGAAYNYYARRPIHQLTGRGVETDADTLSLCVPQAAYRSLDTKSTTLDALDAHLVFLARSGLLMHQTGLVLPTDPRHANLEPLWKHAKAMLARITRYEVVALDGLGDVLLFPKTDWVDEGPHLATLRRDVDGRQRVRAALTDMARLADGTDNVYGPIDGYSGRGPLVLGRRWFWNVRKHILPDFGCGYRALQDESPGLSPELPSEYALDLAFRTAHGHAGRILLWPEASADELDDLVPFPIDQIVERRDSHEGLLRLWLRSRLDK
ncbi:MAG: glycosyltransferase family 39 protein [Planctomycetes bacterium]|nr:glycosyltransferase family 39 protein [Planctomycetota bacterium]